MEDNEIIELYWARSESAIQQTDQKYGRYCRYIAMRILGNAPDTEEIINDTYLKAWNTMPPNRPASLKAYVGMITRQLSLDMYDSKHTQKRCSQTDIVLDELAECIPDKSSQSIEDNIALRDALNKFIRSLDSKAQKIFVRRYWYMSTSSEIAEEYEISESNVNVILFRTRKKLKKFLQKEGFIHE